MLNNKISIWARFLNTSLVCNSLFREQRCREDAA